LLSAPQNTESRLLMASNKMARKLLLLVELLPMLLLLTEPMSLLLWEVDAPLLEKFLTSSSLEMISRPLSELSCGVEISTTTCPDSSNSRSLSISHASWLFSLLHFCSVNHPSQQFNFSGSTWSWTPLLPLLLVPNHLFQTLPRENHTPTNK
jgi:hypothetical protein